LLSVVNDYSEHDTVRVSHLAEELNILHDDNTDTHHALVAVA